MSKRILTGVAAAFLCVLLAVPPVGPAAFAETGDGGLKVVPMAEGTQDATANGSQTSGAVTVAPGKRTVKDNVYLLAPTAKAKQVVAIAGSSKKSGANAKIAAFAASKKQTFKVVYDKKGFYTITNVYSGKRLATAAVDVAASTGSTADAASAASDATASDAASGTSTADATAADGSGSTDGTGSDGTASRPAVTSANVAQYSLAKKDLDRAKWRIDEYGKGYRFVNKATGFVLEMASAKHPNGTNVRAGQRTSSSAQRFSLVRPNTLSPSYSKVKGMRYIVMASKAKRVVGIRDESRMEGASVVIRAKRNTNLQRFTIKKASTKGTYYLQNVGTKRVVSLAKKSKRNNVNVVMRDGKGKSYQKWQVVYNDDFTLAFKNAYSGKYLNIAGGRSASNTNVRASTAKTSSKAQKFKLQKTKAISETVTIDVPCYLQNPELPTGCESVACTNAIRYWGYNLGKTTIADRWMPYGSDGVYNFIGNPRNSSGWIICAPGIANTANAYLRSVGSNVRASVVKGAGLSSLRQYLDKGCPVIVWTTIGMGWPGTVQWWNGGYPLRSNNHAVVLSGYDPNTGAYRVSDSLAGVVWRNGSSFEWLYNEMGRQAVVLSR